MIKLILARSSNHVIGNNNTLPWRIKKDLEIFKEKTLNQTVVMGRKTFESLPDSFKPLPNRNNMVITSHILFNYPGVTAINKPNDFFIEQFVKTFTNEHVPKDEVVWVIGGLEIYNLAMPFASEIHVTEIMKEYAGDTYFPPIDLNKFVLTNSSEVITDSGSNVDFYISTYKRKLPIQIL